MTELVQEQRLALAPLRRALLADAHAEAHRMRRRAQDAGRQAVAAAEQEVAAMLAAARAQGEEDGAAQRREPDAKAAESSGLTGELLDREALRRVDLDKRVER